MTLTLADLEHWDPEAIRGVARAATARADAASAVSARLGLLSLFAVWDGAAARAAYAAVTAIRAALDEHAEQARAVAGAASRAAEDVARITTKLHALGDDERDDVIADAESVDAELARAIGAAITAFPAPSSGDSEVGRWWNGVTGAERAALLIADPDRLGNLAGIPAADRDTANRAAMEADLRCVIETAADHRVTVDEVLTDPGSHGLTDTQAIRYVNALNIQEGLTVNAMRTGADTLLLIYRPEQFGGQGRAAIALGDPDRAARTTVLVPGTGSSVRSGWLTDPDAANLFNEITTAAVDVPVSLVAWMGYDAPDSLLDARVADPGLARRGGAVLAADVRALNATSRSGSHVTVVGHSYGSTTVADSAAGSGMRADDIVLVGSPGTDLAHRAADFHLPADGHLFVGSASSDPVTNIAGLDGALGADPAADGFGSTRFKAEVPGFTVEIWKDHSRYFDTGSESLYSIADIAAGDGEALQQHGMTAAHRNGVFGRLGTALGLPSWSNPLADPELPRPATTGHFHVH